MPKLNQIDAQNSYLDGLAQFKGWLTDFMMQWYGPSIERLIGASYNLLDQATKEQLEQMTPGITEQLDRKFRVKE